MNFFKKNFFNSKNKIGVDISDNSIKFAQIGNNKKNNILQKFGNFSLAKGDVIDGKIVNEKNVKKIIKDAYFKLNLDSKKIIYSVPEKNVFHRTIILSQINENKIDEVVKWEINSDRQEAVENFYYTWNIVDYLEEEEKSVVDISFVSKNIVEQMNRMFTDLNLQVLGCEFESNTYLNYLPRDKFVNKSLLIIDVSDKNSNFTIYDKGSVKLTVDNCFSSDLMTDILAKTFNISFDEAEKMKQTQGIGQVFNNDHFFNAVQPVVDGIVMDAKNLENFYLEQNNLGNSIDDVLVVGGGARMKGLSKYLAYRLEKREISLGRRGDVCVDGLDLRENELAQYVVAIGTALS
ncbi:MAG: pilus assembly protein PilM [Candidatus Moranbacteria bacterium]|nr:pilus assembly protein PilM [Candidatus Moranbacteria bacterium]